MESEGRTNFQIKFIFWTTFSGKDWEHYASWLWKHYKAQDLTVSVSLTIAHPPVTDKTFILLVHRSKGADLSKGVLFSTWNGVNWIHIASKYLLEYLQSDKECLLFLSCLLGHKKGLPNEKQHMHAERIEIVRNLCFAWQDAFTPPSWGLCCFVCGLPKCHSRWDIFR